VKKRIQAQITSADSQFLPDLGSNNPDERIHAAHALGDTRFSMKLTFGRSSGLKASLFHEIARDCSQRIGRVPPDGKVLL
jgi:hypothetical protein